MAKILGSEAKIGIKIGVTHGTAVNVTGANGLAFDSLEYNDNPETLEFSTKGLGRSMKNYLQLGRLSPSLTLNYKLKFGGVGQALLANFFGLDTTPSETTASQGDYQRFCYYSSTARFFTIAVQSSTSTSLEWASCYPSSVTLNYESFQPVSVSINFVTTPRKNTPATNTYANLNSVTISDQNDSWIIFNQSSRVASLGMGSGVPSTHSYHVQSININLEKNWEVTNEVTGTAVTGAPNRTGLFMCTMDMTHSGLVDHSFFTLYENETPRSFNIRVNGSQIGSGVNEALLFYIPSAKLTADPVAPISSDGFNSFTTNWEAYIEPNSSFSSTYPTPFLSVTNQASARYTS